MNDLLKCDLLLNKLKNLSVRFHPKSDVSIHILRDLVETFYVLSEEDKEIVISSIDNKLSMVLLGLSDFCADKALDTKDSIWIDIALMAHVIENFQFDYRENLMSLVVISFANNLITNKKFRELIQDLRPMMNYKAYKELTKFQINNNDINSFGLKTIMKDGKLRIVPES